MMSEERERKKRKKKENKGKKEQNNEILRSPSHLLFNMPNYKDVKYLVGLQIIVKLNEEMLKHARVFLGAKGKLKFITYGRPSIKEKTTSSDKASKDWEWENCLIMKWSWNNIERAINANLIFLDTANET